MCPCPWLSLADLQNRSFSDAPLVKNCSNILGFWTPMIGNSTSVRRIQISHFPIRTNICILIVLWHAITYYRIHTHASHGQCACPTRRLCIVSHFVVYSFRSIHVISAKCPILWLVNRILKEPYLFFLPTDSNISFSCVQRIILVSFWISAHLNQCALFVIDI